MYCATTCISSFILNIGHTAVNAADESKQGSLVKTHTQHATEGQLAGETVAVGSRDGVLPYHTPLYWIRRGRADAEKPKHLGHL